jgi:hypothetical protein
MEPTLEVGKITPATGNNLDRFICPMQDQSAKDALEYGTDPRQFVSSESRSSLLPGPCIRPMRIEPQRKSGPSYPLRVVPGR